MSVPFPAQAPMKNEPLAQHLGIFAQREQLPEKLLLPALLSVVDRNQVACQRRDRKQRARDRRSAQRARRRLPEGGGVVFQAKLKQRSLGITEPHVSQVFMHVSGADLIAAQTRQPRKDTVHVQDIAASHKSGSVNLTKQDSLRLDTLHFSAQPFNNGHSCQVCLKRLPPGGGGPVRLFPERRGHPESVQVEHLDLTPA